MHFFEEMAAIVSSGQLAVTVLLFWRVMRLEKKFENGINKQLNYIRHKQHLAELACARRHGDDNK